jgi:hypothetical protein
MPNNSYNKGDPIMSQNPEEVEVQIAFAVWELLAQLESLLWERYFEQFNDIMRDLETQRGMTFPF